VDLSKVPKKTTIFCTPTTREITCLNFKSHFRIHNAKDELFLQYTETLTQNELEILVGFITGKKRFPVPSIGEALMQVAWTSTDCLTGSLPISQNCTNTVVIVDTANDLQSLKALFTPIFKFDTQFGFA
jgi:hypothetical protein